MAGKKNLDDRQIRFLAAYLDPRSTTYTDAKQSALTVGYSKDYADVITARSLEWMSEGVRTRDSLLKKAERNLDRVLDVDETSKHIRPGILGIKIDASKFVAETLGKETYSKKGQGGLQVNIQINTSPALVKRYESATNPDTGGGGGQPA